MLKIDVDTNKMKELGKSIITNNVNLTNELKGLKNRLDKMVTETFEWEGNSAENFVKTVDLQIKELEPFLQMIDNYGRLLINEAENYENATRSVPGLK